MSTTYRELRRSVDELCKTEEGITAARQKHLDAQIRLGRALRSCREHRNLSLRQCASVLKVSAPYLSDVENGRRGITTGNLELLMGIVGPPPLSDIIETLKQNVKMNDIAPSDEMGRIAAMSSQSEGLG